jgi:hypothetical protein
VVPEGELPALYVCKTLHEYSTHATTSSKTK